MADDYDDFSGGRAGGGFFSRLFRWVGVFFYILFLILIVAGVLSIPAFMIFSLYVSSAITIPWITSFLVGAGLAHSLALFTAIMMVPLVYFAIAGTFVGIVNWINRIRGKQTIEQYLAEKKASFQGPTLSRIVTLLIILSIIFGVPTGIGVGIYLSVLIIPAAITSIMAMGVSAPLATFAGIFLAFGLVGMSVSFFQTPIELLYLYSITPKKNDILKNPMQVLGLLSIFAGLGFGIYSATILYPVLLTALTTSLAITQATAVFASLILVFSLAITITTLFHMGATGLALLFSYNRKHSYGQGVGYERTQISSQSVYPHQHQYHQLPDDQVHHASQITGPRPQPRGFSGGVIS